MTVQQMQMTYYRHDLTAAGFDPGQVSGDIRGRLVEAFVPAGQVELAATYRYRAVDGLRRAEPYRFADPLPDWAVGVRFVVEVEYGAPGELAARGLTGPLVTVEDETVST